MTASIESSSQPTQKVSIFFSGIALFSMFFGAGNLIFPLLVGQAAGDATPFAILGLGISAVAFPLLGLVSVMLFGGSLMRFLERLGKWPALFFLFVCQASHGPTGAIARLVTLMHASFRTYIPSLSLFVFSFLICGLIFLLTVRPKRIVDLLGSLLTPFLLASLSVLVLVGITDGSVARHVPEGGWYHFLHGLKGGYQTMDLLGALLFATVIFPHLSKGTEHMPKKAAQKVLRKRMGYASLIASILLMLVYIGMSWIAATHLSVQDTALPPEQLLLHISQNVLGPTGSLVSAIAIFFACLTTGISLSAVFAQYLKEVLCKDKISFPSALGITLFITAIFANLGFETIVRVLTPILEIMYPAIIVLCLLNIAHSFYALKPIKTPVFATMGISIGGMLL